MKYLSKHSYITSDMYRKSNFSRVSKNSISKQSSLKIFAPPVASISLAPGRFWAAFRIEEHQLKNWSLSRSKNALMTRDSQSTYN